MSHEVLIKKADEARRLVYAEVYVPDRLDTDNEFMTREDIEFMAHGFLRDGYQTKVDSGHSNQLVPGACVVESFVARKGDPDFIEGAWVVCMHVDNDEEWSKIEKGEINGFSVEALVHKDTVEIEVDYPPVIAGKTLTYKSEDGEEHSHTFHVAYDEEGRFLGGNTNLVNGHSHRIIKGTVTELANDHRHKFSHIEELEIHPE